MPARKYTHIAEQEEGIQAVRETGATRQEIAERFGLSKVQIKNWINRYNRKQAKLAAGILPRSKGRARKNAVPRDIMIAQAYEIQRLQKENKLLRLMKKYDLLSEIRCRRKWQQMGQQLHKYENLLNRDFHADRPNRKWVTDISYIHTKQGVLYLSMIRDLYDNSTVAYKTGTQQTVKLVLDTIRLAMKPENKKVTAELPLYGNQGFQYTSPHNPCFFLPGVFFVLSTQYGAVYIIEGLNRQFRKVTKNKPSFTNDDSLRKMLYLAAKNITRHWNGTRRNWDMVSDYLRILFEENTAG